MARIPNIMKQGSMSDRTKKLERQQKEDVGARRLTNSSLGSGGIQVVDGGSITARGGGSLEVFDGGGVLINDGGSITVVGTGSFESKNVDGRRSAWIGNAAMNDGSAETRYGAVVAVYAPSGSPCFYVWDPNGQEEFRTTSIGTFNNRMGAFTSYAAVTKVNSDVTAIYGMEELGLYSAAFENSRIYMNPPEGSGSFSLTIGTNGRLYRTASTRAVKTDIEDYLVNPRTVLDMKPRTWRSKHEVAENPECSNWQVGFIAEELDELGLTGFVEYDHNERPVSIAYDRLSVAMLAVVKDQDRRLNEIEARLAVLDDLEATPAPVVDWSEKPKRCGEAPTSDNVAPIHPEGNNDDQGTATPPESPGVPDSPPEGSG